MAVLSSAQKWNRVMVQNAAYQRQRRMYKRKVHEEPSKPRPMAALERTAPVIGPVYRSELS